MRLSGAVLAAISVFGTGVALAQTSEATTAPLPAGPLTLQQCVQIALQRHPDMISAQAALRQAQAQAKIAGSPLYPQLSLDWNARVTQSLPRPVNVGGGVIQTMGQRTTQRNASAGLDWTLFQSGRRARLSQAKTEAAAAAHDLDDARRLLIYNVQNSYYQVLAARQQLQVAMRAVANSQRHLDLVQGRLDAGQVPESDLLPVRTEVAQARLASINAETDMGLAESQLRSWLLAPPGAPLELAEPLPEQPPAAELNELLRTARDNRPDLLAQGLSVRAAALGTRVARTQAGVQLSASGNADYGRHTGTTGQSWSVQVAATYPLFDAGASRAEVVSAVAREQQARQRLARIELQVQQEVEAASLRVRQTQAAVQAAVVAQAEATSNLAAAEARYREGLALIIEVTDAQLQMTQADLVALSARYDYALALADLARAVGLPPTAAVGDAK